MADDGKFAVSTFPSSRLIVRVHSSWGPSLGIAPSPGPERTVTCACGAITVRAQVWLDSGVPTQMVLLSSALAERMNATDIVSQLRARLDVDTVQLGPLIGILCNPVWDRRNERLKSNVQLPALQKLVQESRSQGAVAYLFRVEDVDFQGLKTIGYVQDGPAWKPAVLPLPDVIYDQVVSRRLERRADHGRRRARLSKLYGERFFNDGFFDKWQVYEWLARDPRVRAHLPVTARLNRSQDLVTFVQQHSVTFVKPVHGSLGLGILRIVREPDGSVTYALKRARGAPLQGRADHPGDIAAALRRRLLARPHLLQQGIALRTYRDRPFDIRILLQRDGEGVWRRTKMFARIAGPGDFTSNLSSGGEAVPVGQVLAELYSKPADRVRCRRQISRLSKWTAEVLEQQAQRRFGELGIDMGVDETGRVWVIEVNSKPWKTTLSLRGRQDLADLAFTRPIQYAIWLSRRK